MKLIVGLGNPGNEYKRTRHNIGFIIIDNYLNNDNSNMKEKFNSLYLKKGDTIFLKPLTYMNNSGQAIRKIIDFYKIDPKDVYVFYDDMDLEFGRLRLRDKGSSGGHNGIKSIISHIGENFNRIKFGIGSKKNDTISHVLGNFSKDEEEEINKKLVILNNLIDDIKKDIDITNLKNKYNNK